MHKENLKQMQAIEKECQEFMTSKEYIHYKDKRLKEFIHWHTLDIQRMKREGEQEMSVKGSWNRNDPKDVEKSPLFCQRCGKGRKSCTCKNFLPIKANKK